MRIRKAWQSRGKVGVKGEGKRVLRSGGAVSHRSLWIAEFGGTETQFDPCIVFLPSIHI
jgi:hypothetical protein